MSLRRLGLRSLRNKLALLFFAITALAFAGLYFYVVPQLESNLEDQQLDELGGVARASEPTLQALSGPRDLTARQLDRRVRAVADAANARITLLGVQASLTSDGGPRPQDLDFYVITDSREERQVPSNRDLAVRAVLGRRLVRGRGELDGERLGQVAQPIALDGPVYRVALYSRDLADVAQTVSFIRDRLLVASGAALFLALLGGYLVARAVARRVRRLERAAVEVTAGRFMEPLPVDSEDEIGQLTRTFNAMQEQLRRVDVARKDFIATASHELRTPIFSLAGFVELLREEELDDETKGEFLDTMAEQVERLQKLAVDLLDLSRLDAGSVELEREPVDISELARAVATEFTPAVTRHSTDLELSLPARIAARCDRGRVAQIMRILLDNALRHTPEGTRVTVAARRANGTALLTVADDGPGLPDDGQVFDRFYTGDAARGAGLGLAIARELAERMDGSLRVDSRDGGSAFTLELPADGR